MDMIKYSEKTPTFLLPLKHGYDKIFRENSNIFYHQAVQETGQKLMEESDIGATDIKTRLEQLASSWTELKDMAADRLV